MIIAFWSDFHGQTGTTTNTISTATYIALKYDLKVLLTHSQFSKSNMENAFFYGHQKESVLNFEDTGIDAMERLSKAGLLKTEDIHNYSRTLINDRLDLLTGSTSSIRRADEAEHLVSILQTAKEAYNLIFVDVNAGMQTDVSSKILENADIIVVNLNQNVTILNNYFKEVCQNFKEKEIVLLLGNYNEVSKYSAKYIRNKYKYKKDIYLVPYDTGLMDSINDQNVLNYFLFRSESATILNQELDRLSKHLLIKSDIDLKLNYDPVKKGNFITRSFKQLINNRNVG